MKWNEMSYNIRRDNQIVEDNVNYINQLSKDVIFYGLYEDLYSENTLSVEQCFFESEDK